MSKEIPTTMKAAVTVGNGDYDKIEYKDVSVPQLREGEVLVQVAAAGVNNTEINTRLGWYSSSFKGSTEDTAKQQAEGTIEKEDGGWGGATPWPLIQGTDCCGFVVKVNNSKDEGLMNKRVIIRCSIRPSWESYDNVWMASDFDGAFAQYVRIPATEVFPVECDWSDAELASIPCAYGTSENMLYRVNVGPKDVVLIPGASGGVGSATVQLAKRRGAKVIAQCGKDKMEVVKGLGADVVYSRDDDLMKELGAETVTVVVDNVGGTAFPTLLELLKRGGRYVSSGAIGGPVVELDLRTMYLKNISLIGTTAWEEPIFPNLISYIEKGELKPLVAKTFPLSDIVQAQKEFLLKKHVGKFVLLPPQ
eukprot:GFYU01022908.1.p1 GENE.GFYU01022908.1~~GFYU01022908.1.p1  ORF type:complete len:363 (-),score=95.06 GFYU01022908.1:140-1228(-)